MSFRRKILLSLLIIPAVMMFVSIVLPGTGFELAFLVLGVPILVLNAWEFNSPNAIFPLMSSHKKMQSKEIEQEGFFMRNKSILVLILLIVLFIILIGGYAAMRSINDHVPFMYALYIFLVKLSSKLWNFLTIPAIFISLLGFFLLWLFIKLILAAVKGTKESDSVKFPDVFYQPALTPIPVDAFPAGPTEAGTPENAGTAPTMEWLIGQGVDLKAVQLMLDLDGKDISKPDLLSKIDELGVNSAGLPVRANEIQKEAYYRGVLEGLFGYVFPIFCSMEMKNKNAVARFELKAGVRERFSERLERLNNPDESFAI